MDAPSGTAKKGRASRASSVKSSGRPGSGTRTRRPVGEVDEQVPQIRTERPDDDEPAEHRRRFQDIEDRRLKEFENFQRSHRASIDELRPTVFMDVTIGDAPAGRLVFELFEEVVPATAGNFRALITGAAQYDLDTGIKLDYVDSSFHRIIPGVAILGGELQARSLSASGAPLKEENFKRRHTERGLLSTVSRGPNTVGSCFSITLAPAPELDFIQVVFGKLVDGAAVLDAIEAVECSRTGVPKQRLLISFCGALTGEKPSGVHVPLQELRAAAAAEAAAAAAEAETDPLAPSADSRELVAIIPHSSADEPAVGGGDAFGDHSSYAGSNTQNDVEGREAAPDVQIDDAGLAELHPEPEKQANKSEAEETAMVGEEKNDEQEEAQHSDAAAAPEEDVGAAER